MHRAFANARGLSMMAPSLLLESNNLKAVDAIANKLPYETGIEIECAEIGYDASTVTTESWLCHSLNGQSLKEIRHIIDVKHDANEKRFRIPTGIEGMICLHDVCKFLEKTCVENPSSGIHYHIDCRDVYNRRPEHDYVKMDDFCSWVRNNGHDRWILNSLRTWKYTGVFNSWEVTRSKTAVKFHMENQTIEFRIGEMTFDYSLILKRIIHCQNIVRRLKMLYNASLMSARWNETKAMLAKKKARKDSTESRRIIGSSLPRRMEHSFIW